MRDDNADDQGGEKAPVVMVDVYAPTLRLARAFQEEGHPVVRVQSTPEVPPVYRSSFRTEEFADDIVHYGAFETTLAAVAAHRPAAVLTGGELGVELADRLSAALGLATNGTRLSAARRHKHTQIETIKAAGLPGTRQHLAVSARYAADWHRELGGRAVVKPVRSAGNDHVSFCASPEETAAAYEKIMAATNIFSFRNEGVVVQEHLEGTEYVVNTVSRDGRHRCTDVWRYMKISANGVTDRISAAVSTHPGSAERARLVEYGFDVLDALEVRHGPAHLEIMLTPDGPRLVEAGIRLCGADAAYFARLAAGESQIERTVDAYLRPERFLATVGDAHRVERHVAMAYLTSPVSGTLAGYPLLPQVEALESFHNVHIAVPEGGRLPLTVDDTTEPMMIGLAHASEHVLARDLNTVHYLDGAGFYRLADPGGAA
ncbi:ATP-grasp domain-containing protein [Streptomyces vilmorinianum]|uniref:ATP-grasp domain-containing protein n=1 Tax=Streptomyces vilmorinianum TaxID=3051092 RepID=UPI001C2FD575|nr:ATP-grasp domain-containing protein [Streptomyces vilmorinianum]